MMKIAEGKLKCARVSDRMLFVAFVLLSFAFRNLWRVHNVKCVTEKHCQFLLNWLFIENRDVCTLSKIHIRHFHACQLSAGFDWMRAKTFRKIYAHSSQHFFFCFLEMMETRIFRSTLYHDPWISRKYCKRLGSQRIACAICSTSFASLCTQARISFCKFAGSQFTLLEYLFTALRGDRKLDWNSTVKLMIQFSVGSCIYVGRQLINRMKIPGYN